MDLYIGHNRPPFVEFGAELLPDFILRKDPNRCSEVRPRCSEPRTGSNALKRGQGALNAGRGDLNVRNNHLLIIPRLRGILRRGPGAPKMIRRRGILMRRSLMSGQNS